MTEAGALRFRLSQKGAKAAGLRQKSRKSKDYVLKNQKMRGVYVGKAGSLLPECRGIAFGTHGVCFGKEGCLGREGGGF